MAVFKTRDKITKVVKQNKPVAMWRVIDWKPHTNIPTADSSKVAVASPSDILEAESGIVASIRYHR